MKLQEVAEDPSGLTNGGCGGRMLSPPANACRWNVRLPVCGLPPATALRKCDGRWTRLLCNTCHLGSDVVLVLSATSKATGLTAQETRASPVATKLCSFILL